MGQHFAFGGQMKEKIIRWLFNKLNVSDWNIFNLWMKSSLFPSIITFFCILPASTIGWLLIKIVPFLLAIVGIMLLSIFIAMKITTARLDIKFMSWFIINYLNILCKEGMLFDTSKDRFFYHILSNFIWNPEDPETGLSMSFEEGREKKLTSFYQSDFIDVHLLCTEKSQKYFECYIIAHKTSIKIPMTEKYWDSVKIYLDPEYRKNKT
jgi:hypothetical protein